MIYEENMKIGFLGGVKAGKFNSCIEDQYHANLKWLITTDKPRSDRGGFQREVRTSMAPEFVNYNLMILKKDGVMKFFYVLEGMSRDEIKMQVEEHWDKSDILGYEFD